MKNTSLDCRACGHHIDKTGTDLYLFCSCCGSANYSSERSAQEDNELYFNGIYTRSDLTVVRRRQQWFEKYDRFHSLIHIGETRRFHLILNSISQLTRKAAKVVEIGFGSGDELIGHLRAGANIYGVDLSSEAVRNFKNRYPDYADRVKSGNTSDLYADVVYANALFEHLDDPAEFLRNVSGMLQPKGKLILRLPVISRAISPGQTALVDINFWSPCHRVLYSITGLNELLGRHQYKITASAGLAYYGYKVMNCLLKDGNTEIMNIRNPYYALEGLTDDRVYRMILLRSLFTETICSDLAVIAEKIN